MDIDAASDLCDNALQCQLLLLQVITARVLNFELRHGVRQRALDLLLLTSLELHAHRRVRDNLLNPADVALELLSRLELLAESLVARLELLGVWTS